MGNRAESRADWFKVYGGAAALCLVVFIIAYQFVEPAPPRELTITAGDSKGAYYRFAKHYQLILARAGITLRVKSSQGTQDNLDRLTDPNSGVDLGLVQGGVAGDDKRYHQLRSLGSLYYEPLWIFHQRDLDPSTLAALKGRTIAVGSAGSGTRAVVSRLLTDNGVTPATATYLSIGGAAAADALLNGDVEVAAFVSAPSAEAVARLLRSDAVTLFAFRRASAYARIYPYLNRVTLPRGAVSLEDDVPRADVELLAPAATLVARGSLHPALIDLLLQAASEVHGNGDTFADRGQFPSPALTDLTLSDEARRFYESGPPFLQRYLPFWAATLVDRLKVLILPLVTVLIPLVKLVPPFYSWRVRRRIYRWYRDVREIESQYLDAPTPAKRTGSLAALDAIEAELVDLKVPLGVADALYHLRTHIRFVREELGSVGEP
ncbi:MAG: TAXI family TRAP transporter solute-binding subunit [Pseudomonadota bacterium]